MSTNHTLTLILREDAGIGEDEFMLMDDVDA